MPGASLSSTARVASGVTSRGVRPVPPVVRTRSARSASAQAARAAAIRTVSSGTRARAARMKSCSAAQAAMASPEVSARSPRWPASEMVRIARRILLLLHAPLRQERQLHPLRREPLTAAVDLELRSRLCRRRGQVGGSDPHAERRAQRAAPDDVDFAALVKHRIAVAREAAALEPEAHQPPGDAALLLGAE